MSRSLLVLLIALITGCANAPEAEPTAGTITPPSTATSGVRLVLLATSDTVEAGDPITFRLILENRNGTPLWTNPTFACSGTWDLGLYDAQGERVRIDDRDALGCPSGGPLETRVEAGRDATAEYAWDGQTRPSLGQAEAPPPGRYEVRASAAYGDAPDDGELETRTAELTLTLT